MKTQLTLFLSALILFTGCVAVTFPEPMPMNRRSLTCFPTAWQGVWTAVATDSETETITISATHIDLGGDLVLLGEAAVVRRFAGYLVLSITTEEDEGRWQIYLGEITQGVLHVYNFDGDEEEKVAIWELVLGGDSVERVAKSVDDSEVKEYRLNPENNIAFRELITKGGLSSQGKYVK